MNISMKEGLFTLEFVHPNSENIEGFNKSDNFTNAIAFGVSLFIFCDLNTYFQLYFAVHFSFLPLKHTFKIY